MAFRIYKILTVSIDGAKNAALLALSILAIGNAALLSKLRNFKTDQTKSVLKKAKELEAVGYKEYLKKHNE